MGDAGGAQRLSDRGRQRVGDRHRLGVRASVRVTGAQDIARAGPEALAAGELADALFEGERVIEEAELDLVEDGVGSVDDGAGRPVGSAADDAVEIAALL